MNIEQNIGAISDEHTQIVLREMWRRLREAVATIDGNVADIRAQVADLNRRVGFLESNVRR
jgi:hypothetical protein